ncbi:MAG: hypothetical protein COT80_02540 [Candidatus Buchananbacteria bacterium CG10_big_fil_rev_8_21_14_0_10_33_19]|uniref:Uncharacterized protein n=1 Tax=Candidatus Buchananbacteria bacterium CG10_big_fil_rev_8_21_14_0_10_33_19 TaxID=1974525 RepID=A0A2H0W618_9BACT|nr:MAG: hypothetical protein COT80_02540 [Candidatus Buchananbacteria bacterium CG10_big_fil_rev_8_21_14_0_10_33_19]
MISEDKSQIINQSQIEEELSQMQSKIRVLEWDKSRKQINPAKAAKLTNMLKRKEELEQQLEKLVN